MNDWVYSDEVKDHFFNPRNYISGDEPNFKYNGKGEMGNEEEGNIVRIWIKVNPKTKCVEKCGWQTFGCASAIAATSMASVMITGMTLNEIEKLNDIPHEKAYCAIRGKEAIVMAIKNYLSQLRS